jgi:hypothetical protein
MDAFRTTCSLEPCDRCEASRLALDELSTRQIFVLFVTGKKQELPRVHEAETQPMIGHSHA